MLIIVNRKAASQGFSYGKGVREVPEKMAKAMIKAKAALEPTKEDEAAIKAYAISEVRNLKLRLVDAQNKKRRADEKIAFLGKRVNQAKDELKYAQGLVKIAETKAAYVAKGNDKK